MGVFTSPAFIGLVIAIPSFVLGYLGYRRSLKVDKIAEQSGIASNQIGAVGQVIDGLNKLVANLQEDNRNLRLDLADLRQKYTELSESCDKIKRAIESMQRTQARDAADNTPTSVS